MAKAIQGRIIIDLAANRPPPVPRNKDVTFISKDTGTIETCDGTAWSSAGGASLPGVTSDGSGGVLITGAVRSGVGGTFSRFNGALEISSNQTDYSNGQPPLQTLQQGTLDSGDGSMQAIFIQRYVDRAGLPVGNPVFEISADDASGGANPIPATEPVFRSTSGTKHVTTYADGSVEADGDVIVHGKLRTGASVTHTLGAYSGKSVPIYDATGTLLGFAPLYA